MVLLCIITKEGFLEEEVFHRLSLIGVLRKGGFVLNCDDTSDRSRFSDRLVLHFFG